MDFQWDPIKAELNLKKHRVSFKEAATVFADPLSSTFNDPDHSRGEHRYLIIGRSNTGQILVVSHTERKNQIRTYQCANRIKAGDEIL